MKEKQKREYTDFSNVEKQRDYLASEGLPEGPYGSPIRKNEPVENKNTPWHEGQRYYTPFNYEYKSLHQNIPRQYPGAHPVHDDPKKDEQPPYTT